jgi:hypothetical protein
MMRSQVAQADGSPVECTGPGQSGGGTETRSFGPKLRLPLVYWGA